MDEIMNKPPKLIFDKVKRDWEYMRPKSFLAKLISLIIIRPVAIEIVQTKSFNERTHECTGETLNKWRYNDAGIQLLPSKTDSGQREVEYCYFCIDKEKKRLAIEWANMFSGAFRGSKIKYFHNGWVFEIIEHNGVEDYKQISSWIE